MDKYVRVDWPESCCWLDESLSDDVVVCPNGAVPIVFVPEELYNQVTAVEEPKIPDEFDPIWDEYEGMPEESKPWFMKNE